MVKLFVDEVDRAAGDLNAVFEGLELRVEAREGGQQRGVDVEDALRVGQDESSREQAHVAGEADEVDFVGLQSGDDFKVVLLALAAVGFDGDGFEATIARGGEAGGGGQV